jgi:hypothetical protein
MPFSGKPEFIDKMGSLGEISNPRPINNLIKPVKLWFF